MVDSPEVSFSGTRSNKTLREQRQPAHLPRQSEKFLAKVHRKLPPMRPRFLSDFRMRNQFLRLSRNLEKILRLQRSKYRQLQYMQ